MEINRTISAALYTFFLLLAACVPEPDPLPTEVRAASANLQIERLDQPPLYQMLYDYAFLPEVQYQEQRVRILIWLRHMELSSYQLRSLAQLATQTLREGEEIETLQQNVVERYEARIAPIYDTLWTELKAGTPLDDATLESAAGGLLSERLQHAREKDLLKLRHQAVRTILDKSLDWLGSLNPRQEALLTDSLFFLRHRLDPYANPGNFRALIGTVFVAGDYGTLTRGSFDADRDHLNLGALWTENSLEDEQGPVFNDARRSLVVYMILLEPALPEAIEAALSIAEAATQTPPTEAPQPEETAPKVPEPSDTPDGP